MVKTLEKIVKQNKEKIAYKINNESITYGKLWDKANFYADYLRRQGSEPVIIYGHKSIDMIISIVACLIAGRTYIPVDISIPIFRINKIIELSKPSLFIKNEDIIIDTNIPICSLDEFERFERCDIKHFNEDIVYIIFTSGSTGEPKGVPISKTNLENFINWISSLLGQYKDINVLNTANFNFDLSVADMYYSLFNGHTLIGLDDVSDYNLIFNTLKDINLVVMTPSFIKLCLINKDFNEINYPNLKCLYFCGEELEVCVVKKIYERFSNINIINAYGPTEATSAVSGIKITKDMLSDKLLPVGKRGKFATDIEIINDEIILKGKSVFNGYLNNNCSEYYLDGNINCYRTGDLGYFKGDLLYCKGRVDNQIKYKGYRIELGEVEAVIKSFDNIIDCIVIPKYNENNIIKFLEAFIVCNKELSKGNIISSLKEKLPNYMIPKKIIFLDKLPINNNGKIDRKKLMNYD